MRPTKRLYVKKKYKSKDFKIFLPCQMLQHEKCPVTYTYKSNLKNYTSHTRTCKCPCHRKSAKKS